MIITKNGYTIKFNASEITPSGRLTMGLKGINLNEDDEVITVLPIRHQEDDIAVFSSKGYGKRVKINEFPAQKRGGKGATICKPNEGFGYITCGQLITDDDTILIVGNKNSVCISSNEIPTVGRGAIGNLMLKDNIILSVSKV